MSESTTDDLTIETEQRGDHWAAFVVGRGHVGYGDTEQDARERVSLMYGVTKGMKIAEQRRAEERAASSEREARLRDEITHYVEAKTRAWGIGFTYEHDCSMIDDCPITAAALAGEA